MHEPDELSLFAGKLEATGAPYMVLRKLEYFREGGSAKHRADIRAIVAVTGLEDELMRPWLECMGLAGLLKMVLSDE